MRKAAQKHRNGKPKVHVVFLRYKHVHTERDGKNS